MTEPQPVSKKTYVVVWAILLGLFLITLGAAYLDLGPWNTIVALTIAACKAALIILFFMHVLHSDGLTWLFVGAGIFWLVVAGILTMSDYLTRSWLPVAGW